MSGLFQRLASSAPKAGEVAPRPVLRYEPGGVAGSEADGPGGALADVPMPPPPPPSMRGSPRARPVPLDAGLRSAELPQSSGERETSGQRRRIETFSVHAPTVPQHGGDEAGLETVNAIAHGRTMVGMDAAVIITHPAGPPAAAASSAERGDTHYPVSASERVLFRGTPMHPASHDPTAPVAGQDRTSVRPRPVMHEAVAPAASALPDVATPAPAPEPTIIEVSIGRIDVHTPSSPAPRPAAQAPFRPAMGLSDYLERRNRRGT